MTTASNRPVSSRTRCFAGLHAPALYLLLVSSAGPAVAQQLPVLPPLEDEPLVAPPQVEPPSYPVEQLQPMQPLPPAAPEKPLRLRQPEPPVDTPMFSGGGIALQGGLGASTQMLLSFHAGGALFGLGLGLTYNEAGVVGGSTASAGSAPGSTDTIGFQLSTYFAYMAYNTRPLAFGPELDFDAQLAPGTPFGFTTLVPGFAIWYAPFPAPLYIGTMIGLRIGFMSYGNPTVATDYPGVRLRWGF